MYIEIKEGQVWTYKTREGEEDSRAIVFKEEMIHGSPIIHITLTDLKIKSTNGNLLTSIGHLPMDKHAFLQSVISAVSVIDIEPNEGYEDWRNAFNEGKAGVWSAEIAEVVSLTEQTLAG